MVRKERLELSRVAPQDPKSSASTNSATFASFQPTAPAHQVLLQGSIDGFSGLSSSWPRGASRRQWQVLAKRRNTADDCLTTRPKGATRMIQFGVAVLDKDAAILCGLRLALNHPGGSASINTALQEYQSSAAL